MSLGAPPSAVECCEEPLAAVRHRPDGSEQFYGPENEA